MSLKDNLAAAAAVIACLEASAASIAKGEGRNAALELALALDRIESPLIGYIDRAARKDLLDALLGLIGGAHSTGADITQIDALNHRATQLRLALFAQGSVA